MPVHPTIEAMLSGRQALSVCDTPVHEFRSYVRDISTARGPWEVPLGRIEDRTIPGPQTDIPVRIYTPRGQGPFPLLVYFHGGGFVVGDLDTQDNICRGLTVGAQCVVVSVAYRLAPEHKFPAAPDDCYAATVWACQNANVLGADPRSVAVGGDSAGAILAAGVALRARDKGGPGIAAQLLLYGDMTPPETDAEGSAQTFRDGPILNAAAVKQFWTYYLNDFERERTEALAFPACAHSHRGLPAAFIGTAECDICRDGAEAYGDTLRAAGVDVTIRRYAGMVHGFYSWADFLPEAAAALDEAASWLREQLRRVSASRAATTIKGLEGEHN